MYPQLSPKFGLGLGLVFLALSAVVHGDEPIYRIEPSAQRNFGYVIGDPVEYEVLISVPENHALEAEYLPKPGTLTEWLDLRTINWARTDSKGTAQYRLRLTYQVFKGVRQPEKLTIPALTIRFRGQTPFEVQTEPWQIVVAPIIPPDVSDESVELRGFSHPERRSLGPHRLRLAAYLGGILIALAILAWQHGRLPFFRTATPPFARTVRELKKLSRKRDDAEAFRKAVKLLHRALDETYGFRLFGEELETFLTIRPAFAELRDELNHFFALSQRVFFTAPDAPIPADSPLPWLETLCRRCVAAERRNL